MIILTSDFNVSITLTVHKNIMKMQRFKKLIMFKVIFEKSKKILKSNDFLIKDVVIIITFRREKFEIMMHEINIESMLQNIKSEDAKVIEKINVIIYLRLQIKKVK